MTGCRRRLARQPHGAWAIAVAIVLGAAQSVLPAAAQPTGAAKPEVSPASKDGGSASAQPVASPPRSARQSAGARLVAAYPDHLTGVDGNMLIWSDGTRMPIDDGQGVKPFNEWLERPDLEDMLQLPYPAGAAATPPTENADPGRARNAEFFDKMYGDCRRDAVLPRLVEIVWLPKKSGQRLKVTSVNGVAARLDAVSRALDALPSRFDVYLNPAAGTYNCRVVAGTSRVSAHGHGIAIDIALKHADYWRWSKPQADGRRPFRNQIPHEIVEIFEAHGFIWGGRWHHYDTMHFEYRPEMMPTTSAELTPELGPANRLPPRP